MNAQITEQVKTEQVAIYGPDKILSDCVRIRLTRAQMGRILSEIAHNIGQDEISLDIRIWAVASGDQPTRASLSFENSMGFYADVVDQEIIVGRDSA